jgi:hypothetical protein
MYYIEILGSFSVPNRITVLRNGEQIAEVYCMTVGQDATIMRGPNRNLVQAALFADEHVANEVGKAAILGNQKFRVRKASGKILDGGEPIDVRPKDQLTGMKKDDMTVENYPYRARMDPSVLRVIKSYSVHPSTAERIALEAQLSGESHGQVLDRFFAKAGLKKS